MCLRVRPGVRRAGLFEAEPGADAGPAAPRSGAALLIYGLIRQYWWPLRPEAKSGCDRSAQAWSRPAGAVRQRPAACVDGRWDRHSVSHPPSLRRVRGDRGAAHHLSRDVLYDSMRGGKLPYVRGGRHGVILRHLERFLCSRLLA